MQNPGVNLDDLFWEPGGFDNKRSREEVELLVWLDVDWPICKKRLKEGGSESKRHLDREQSEEGLKKLIKWASHYYDRRDLQYIWAAADASRSA